MKKAVLDEEVGGANCHPKMKKAVLGEEGGGANCHPEVPKKAVLDTIG